MPNDRSQANIWGKWSKNRTVNRFDWTWLHVFQFLAVSCKCSLIAIVWLFRDMQRCALDFSRIHFVQNEEEQSLHVCFFTLEATILIVITPLHPPSGPGPPLPDMYHPLFSPTVPIQDLFKVFPQRWFTFDNTAYFVVNTAYTASRQHRAQDDSFATSARILFTIDTI